MSSGARKPADPPDPADRAFRALSAVLDAIDVEGGEETLLADAQSALLRALGAAEVVILGAAGPPAGENPSERTPLAALAAEALRDGHALVRTGSGGGWAAATPLLERSRVLGAAGLAGAGPPPPLAFLEALGRELGTALAAARHCAALREASRRAEVLHRITAALASGSELRSALPAFAAALLDVTGFDRLACGFVNDSGDYIEVATEPQGAAWGFGDVLPLVGSGLGAALLNARPILQPDLVHSHRYIEDMRLLDEGFRSYVVLPLITSGRAIGALGLAWREPNGFGADAVERLAPAAAAAALALENVRLLQKTRELSITDEVTPLFNVRFFHQILERELKLVDRYRSVLSLLFIDLDRFKPINDTYGHLRGSRVLREVGFLLRAAVRETDYPARYGGDEFVVILPQTDGAAGRVLAEKLRRTIEGHLYLQEEGINARVGVSVGVATYPAEAATKEALIRLADQRMYADKGERKGE